MKKKSGVIVVAFAIFFILFALTSILSTMGELFVFAPFIVWFLGVFVIIIIVAVTASKNVKEIKNKFKDEIKNAKDSDEYSSPNSNDDEWLLKKENKKSKGKKCPLCGTLNDNDAIYCKVCGEELNNKF